VQELGSVATVDAPEAPAQGAEGRPRGAPSALQTATAGAFGAGGASEDATVWGQLPPLGRERRVGHELRVPTMEFPQALPLVGEVVGPPRFLDAAPAGSAGDLVATGRYLLERAIHGRQVLMDPGVGGERHRDAPKGAYERAPRPA